MRSTGAATHFDTTVPHDAFWTFNDGFGIADITQAVVFDEVGQRIVEMRDSTATKDRDRLLGDGKARCAGPAGPVHRFQPVSRSIRKVRACGPRLHVEQDRDSFHPAGST